MTIEQKIKLSLGELQFILLAQSQQIEELQIALKTAKEQLSELNTAKPDIAKE